MNCDAGPPESGTPSTANRGAHAEIISANNGQNNGSVPLREVLEEAATLGDYSLGELTVLSQQRGPYRFDTPAGHRDGKWFAEVFERLVPDTNSAVHLRGLHYRIVVARDVIRPDNGLPYTSTEENWKWLSENAAKAARWLGYVPFERIIDERNESPIILVPEAPLKPEAGLSDAGSIEPR
jgi:hypothetical protein